FAIGGDSIRSISLVSAARAQGLQFAIKDLFAHPTIAELASVVVDTGVAGTVRADGTVHPAGQGTDTASTSSTLVPFALLSPEEQARLPRSYRGQAIEDAYPLSMLQQGMWFHSMQNPQSAVYHCVITFAIDADWQPALFREALHSVIQRHPVLRTEFHLDADRPLQFVTTWREPTVEVHDLRTRPGQDKEVGQSQETKETQATKEAAIQAWVLEEKARGLRIDELWRIGILVFEQQIQFGLSFHH
ncbi:condensation domain-containing protein, partial [Undibacterium sp. TJN19]|uniref:condensation domain-containing protein n=1 Tax=Undibacterium sp. TJN19 TaxID=3413055 RepID=UPI003BF06DAC